MAATYEPIATVATSGSTAATVTFSSIPATYTDFRLVANVRTSAAGSIYVKLNNISTSTYSVTVLEQNAAPAVFSQANDTRFNYMANFGSTDTTYPQLYTVDIFSYTSSTNKTVLMTANNNYNGSGNDSVKALVGLWRNTAVVNRLDFTVSNGDFGIAGGQLTLYGIKAA